MKIIHDPLKLGGFKSGATFDKTSLEEMLVERCFTVGTIIELEERCARINCDPGIYRVDTKWHKKKGMVQYLVKHEVGL
jgi:hypothetical protein